MGHAALNGAVIGAVIGGGYAWLQLRSLRRTAQAQQAGQPASLGGNAAGAFSRVALLLVALLVVQLLLPAGQIDKWWLTGALAVSYSVPFFWRLSHMLRRK